MIKKGLVFLLVTTLLFGTGTVTSAADTREGQTGEKTRIVNLSERISEEEIEEISSSVGASLEYEDGTSVPLETVITIEDIVEPQSRSFYMKRETSYKVTISTSFSEGNNTVSSRKIDSDSADKNGTVVASATLQSIWTDVFGWDNIIDKVSGTLTVESGKVTSGTVRYGDGYRSAVLWTTKSVGAAKTFSFSPNMTAFDPSADYDVQFEGQIFSLYLKVSASIFQ